MKVKVSDLQDLIIKIISSKYFTEIQAKEISKVLMFAEKTGKNTQGLLKLMGSEPIQNIKPKSEIKVLTETNLSLLLDGGANPAILVAKKATDLAIKKCLENGFGIVGANNTYSSTGALSYYVNEIAKNDFIGLAMAGSPGAVAPFGGIEPLFGTNPIAFGFPTTKDTLIFDMATSAITWYGLVRAKALGQNIPEVVGINSDGEPTTNPEDVMNGAILPFDKSYKGSGLSMMIEILTGPLVGAAYVDKIGGGDWGNLFIAIDPDLLIGRDKFKESNSKLIEIIKNSKPKKGERIRIPGEESLQKMKIVEETGFLEIEDKLFEDLKRLID